jgi:negative regulator of replication initiation
MRTTLEIDDDLLQAQRIAATEGTDIGKALSDLARRGLGLDGQSTRFPAFDVPPDAPLITLEYVTNALEEE